MEHTHNVETDPRAERLHVRHVFPALVPTVILASQASAASRPRSATSRNVLHFNARVRTTRVLGLGAI